MTREEIMERIKAFARYNKYTLSHNAEKIAEAKRRMGKEWFDCPCQRTGRHFCGSDACTEDIEKNGKCCCGLFIRR